DVLTDTTDPRRIWLSLRPCRRTEAGYEIWVSDEGRPRVLGRPRSPGVDGIVRFFEERIPGAAVTEHDWLEFARTRLGWARDEAAAAIRRVGERRLVPRVLVAHLHLFPLPF